MCLIFIPCSDHCPIVATCSIDTTISPGVLYSSLREDAPLTRCFAVLQFTQLKAKGIKWTEEPSAYVRFYSKVFPSHLRAQTAPDPHVRSPPPSFLNLPRHIPLHGVIMNFK